jgi:hypothetical protein
LFLEQLLCAPCAKAGRGRWQNPCSLIEPAFFCHAPRPCSFFALVQPSTALVAAPAPSRRLSPRSGSWFVRTRSSTRSTRGVRRAAKDVDLCLKHGAHFVPSLSRPLSACHPGPLSLSTIAVEPGDEPAVRSDPPEERQPRLRCRSSPPERRAHLAEHHRPRSERRRPDHHQHPLRHRARRRGNDRPAHWRRCDTRTHCTHARAHARQRGRGHPGASPPAIHERTPHRTATPDPS